MAQGVAVGVRTRGLEGVGADGEGLLQRAHLVLVGQQGLLEVGPLRQLLLQPLNGLVLLREGGLQAADLRAGIAWRMDGGWGDLGGMM